MKSQLATSMTEEEYIALARRKYHDLQQLKTKPTFYEYEKSFDAIWQDLGQQVLEKTLSDVPANRRKKKDDDALRSDTTGPPAR